MKAMVELKKKIAMPILTQKEIFAIRIPIQALEYW
jgi:hypothetical protein